MKPSVPGAPPPPPVGPPALAGPCTGGAPAPPGYGDSTGPDPDRHPGAYAKRATAATLVEVMQALGFPRFAVAGHDRGGRGGHRMALDHPARGAHLPLPPTNPPPA